MNLKPKPTLVIPLWSLLPQRWVLHMHERQQRGIHFHPLSFGRFPNIPFNHCSLLCLSHRLSPQPLIPPRVFLANTFVCLPLSIPQLWFRHQGCSHSLQALDQVTMPLLSRSSCEDAPCQAWRSLPACSLPASPDLWTSTIQPQTPLVSGVAPAMAETPWKIMQTSERRGSRVSCSFRAVFPISCGVK